MATTHIPKKITAIFAIIFLLPALYIYALWIKVSFQDPDLSQTQKISTFENYFPDALQNIKFINYISMAFCLVAIILAANSFRQRMLYLRIIMMLIVIIGSLIFLLDIFQLF